MRDGGKGDKKRKLVVTDEVFESNWDAIFKKDNHSIKENILSDKYEYSQRDIADKMFLAIGTVASTEKRAIEKFKQELADRKIDFKDLLED
jgi:DNA-directed RNA polymerase specialized sigma24 family protein